MRIALAVGLVLAAAAVGVVLSRSPLTVAGTNSTPAKQFVAYVRDGFSRCQQNGTLPGGTSALRISVSANIGPSVTVKVLSGSLVLTQGERDAGWGVQETVTVPVKRVLYAIPNTRICIALGPAIETVEITGAEVRPTAANPHRLRFRVEYLRPGHASWWSLASSVTRRMGFGHAPSGTWVVFLLIALMATVAALTSWLILRELR